MRNLQVITAALIVSVASACGIDGTEGQSPEESDEFGVAEQATGCTSSIYVGTTIRDGGWIKGSGGFTNCTGQLDWVYVVLIRNDSGQSGRFVSPAPGDGFAYSAPDARCSTGTWFTSTQGGFKDGHIERRESNRITISRC